MYAAIRAARQISIHAPREGGDLSFFYTLFEIVVISIHAPREGGDGLSSSGLLNLTDFNPRPPRGGRRKDRSAWGRGVNISIHAPREGGDIMAELAQYIRMPISIHAPREGGDFRRARC